MLSSIIDRLSHTLMVDRLAIFLTDPDRPEQFTLAKSYGIAHIGELELSFLRIERPEWHAGHLFFDNTAQAIRETPTGRETIHRLDLNYYIPCTVMNRMIAVMGLGKTTDGDFLSTEDVELLEALAGYIGIAVQNARLYRSLESKAEQYERLKEFSENIVESISVGVLAVTSKTASSRGISQMEVCMLRPARSIGAMFPARCLLLPLLRRI
jgi:GAF domain-containing protein